MIGKHECAICKEWSGTHHEKTDQYLCGHHFSIADKLHNGHIEEVRRFLKRAFHRTHVNHVTDVDTEFAFDYDGLSCRITVARAFFNSLTKTDIPGILERWKVAEETVTAQGKTIYVGENGLSTLES
jgi:hypothetical protein